MVYARHRRHLSRDPRHGDNMIAFVAAQNARMTVAAVKATGTLTASALADGATVTIGSKTYTFQDTLTNVDGNVKRSGTLATDLANLLKAVNLSGVAGTDYAASMTAHTTVDGVSSTGTTLVVRAKTAGASGNSIATTETSGTAAWGATTLTGGVTSVTPDVKAKLKKYSAERIAAASAYSDLP